MKFVEKRGGKYWPSKEMKKLAVVKSDIYERASKKPVKFWEELAENVHWFKPWKKAYEEKLPYFKWFVGGKLNLSYNCLDRHLEDRANKTAVIFVPEDPLKKETKLSYYDLFVRVNKFANFLKKQGIKKGDVVAIYLPLIPEALISMLACTRIGAIHNVVFSAFSSDALRARIEEGGAKLLITADGYFRRGKVSDLREKADMAVKGTKVKKVILAERIKKRNLRGKYISFDLYENEEPYCKPEEMDSEDTLFILYTSGTASKPRGIVHTTGGYTVQAMHTAKFDFNILENDTIWCTADIGWITGHTYATYGPLLNGITTLIYEGSIDYPSLSRSWEIIDKHKVNIFYTAPTAIRMFKSAGEKHLKGYKLNSLRVLGSVGEPIDETTWRWYFKNIGKKRCPIVDTWWQTETGGHMITSLAGIGPFIPAHAAIPFPGVRISIVTEEDGRTKNSNTGHLVFHPPLPPGFMRDVWKNSKLYREKYWPYKKFYLSLDNATLDSGYIRILGRTDDVIKVAGHRISTAEMEGSILKVKGIMENAVISRPDKLKGEMPVVFVRLKPNFNDGKRIREVIVKALVKDIGPIARPGEIYFVPDLPKTRSGKIMRRVLKDIINKQPTSDLATIVNSDCVDKIKRCVG